MVISAPVFFQLVRPVRDDSLAEDNFFLEGTVRLHTIGDSTPLSDTSLLHDTIVPSYLVVVTLLSYRILISVATMVSTTVLIGTYS